MSVASDRKQRLRDNQKSFFKFSDIELNDIVRRYVNDNECVPYTTDDYQLLYTDFCLYKCAGKQYHPIDLLTISELLIKHLTR